MLFRRRRFSRLCFGKRIPMASAGRCGVGGANAELMAAAARKLGQMDGARRENGPRCLGGARRSLSAAQADRKRMERSRGERKTKTDEIGCSLIARRPSAGKRRLHYHSRGGAISIRLNHCWPSESLMTNEFEIELRAHRLRYFPLAVFSFLRTRDARRCRFQGTTGVHKSLLRFSITLDRRFRFLFSRRTLPTRPADGPISDRIDQRPPFISVSMNNGECTLSKA